MTAEGRRIEVQGTVQGVGFRPWIYRLASGLDSGARVQNDARGVIGAARWQGSLPRRLLLLGLVPESIDLGLERTPVVEAALPALVDAVRAECAALGHPFLPRSAGEASSTPVPAGCDVHRLLGFHLEGVSHV